MNQFELSKKARNSSRQRSTAKMKPRLLEQLRVKTWYQSLIDAAGEDEQSLNSSGFDLSVDPQSWIDAHSSRLSDELHDALSDVARQKYAQGEQSPSALTLEAFEALLSGTRAVYEVGLGALPVWKILGGDLEACEKYLLAALQDSHEVLLPSLEHRLQQLLDALLSPARRLSVREPPALANINDGAHPVWLSFVDSQWHRPDDPEGLLRLEVDTIDDQILAAVALWQLAVARRDPLVFGLEWLLVGLSFGTVAVHLSEPIQSYVLQLVRQTAQRLDEELKRKWPELPGFEQRWLEVIDGRAMFARYLSHA